MFLKVHFTVVSEMSSKITNLEIHIYLTYFPPKESLLFENKQNHKN
jgi:hypothetical protein